MHQTNRNLSLDGLRGIAALTVALLHFFLLFPPSRWTPIWKYSPLYVLIAGREAVVVFFVLSGFALHHMRKSTYGRFALRRVVRIYGPYLAALALAVAGNFFLARGLRSGFSNWFNQAWPIPVNPANIRAHIFFLGDYDTGIFNGAFWSLVHEMRISFVFPILDWVVCDWMVCRQRTAWSILLAIVMITIGSFIGQPNNLGETIHYAGLFVAGIIIARHPSVTVKRRWFVLGALAFYYGRGLSRLLPAQYANLLDLPVGWGASLIVIWAMQSKWLLTKPAQWLGRRSFSLYLVHTPVLLAVVNILNLQSPHFALILLYLPLTLLLTEAFYQTIERPLLKLSRHIRAAPGTLSRQKFPISPDTLT